MKNIKGILIGVLLFVGIGAAIMYWKANEKIADPETVKAEAAFSQHEIMEMDEEMIAAMEGRTIAITGFVLSNEGDETERTISLGKNDMNVIICQIDNRHLSKTSKLGKGQYVKLKGVVTGHDFDDLMGKTIQLKNCAMDSI